MGMVPGPACRLCWAVPSSSLQKGLSAEDLLMPPSLILCATLNILYLNMVFLDSSLSVPFYFDSGDLT